jgi:ribonuclease-3
MDDIIIPYNINNILITESDIKELFSKYNLTININGNNIELYRTALTHKSYIISEYTNYYNNILKEAKILMDNVLDLRLESSERFEFLGDSVIKCIVARYLCDRYLEENEGFLTKIKTKIENRKSLAIFARKLGLDKFLIISKQNEDLNNRISDKFMEDAFEAFMGALLYDQGFDFCDKYIRILLETEIDYSEILYIDTNFKDKLQKYYHLNTWGHPIFEDIGTEMVNGKKHYIVRVMTSDKVEISRAGELTKKKAEQKASMLALLKYNQLYPDQIVDSFE